MPSLVYRPSISPSRWHPFCLEKFLRVQVPLGCVKTAVATQGLESREFVKTMEVDLWFQIWVDRISQRTSANTSPQGSQRSQSVTAVAAVAPLGDHDSVVLAWPLPVSIPASCFFDQEAVRDNSTSSFIRTAIFVPKHVTLSQKMRLALPANKLHC